MSDVALLADHLVADVSFVSHSFGFASRHMRGVFLAHGLDEFVRLFLSSFLGNAVPLLDPAHELITVSGDHIQIVVSQLAPFFAELAF